MGVFGYESTASDQVADAIADAEPFDEESIKEALNSALNYVKFDLKDPSSKSTFVGLVMELLNTKKRVPKKYIEDALKFVKQLQKNKEHINDYDSPAQRLKALKHEEKFLSEKIGKTKKGTTVTKKTASVKKKEHVPLKKTIAKKRKTNSKNVKIHVGKRGGKYYLSKTGRKVYI
jgi:glutamate/tyrosine decarboxylase-like PLP-dependent enzyme